MKLSLWKTASLFAVATLLWSSLGAVQSAPPAWTSQASAAAQFMQQPAALPFAPPSAARAAGPPPLANSTLPVQPFEVCSVNSDSASSPSCSSSGPTVPCSANALSGGRCSVFLNAGGSNGDCSTLDERGKCSVFHPATSPAAGFTRCSVLSDQPAFGLGCSAFATGRRQMCSAANGAEFNSDQCSVIAPSGPLCSLLNTGTTAMSFCSTGFSGGNSQCSTFDGGGNDCSVLPNGRGICTAFKGAPQGSCSVHDMGHCSIIGGASGVRCRRG